MERTVERPYGWAWTAAACVVVGLAHLPLLAQLAQRLWAAEHYQYFPLVLVGAAAIAYERARDLPRLSPGRPSWRRGLTSFAFLLLTLAILVNSSWLGGVAALASLAALIYSIGGRRLFISWLPAWLFLWLAIPLPFGFDRSLITLLQTVATRWASGVLDLIGLRHAVLGVVLKLPEKSFFVEEACSGIHSFFAALACTIFYAFYLRLRFHRTLALAAVAVFWVIVANAVRVILVAVLTTQWGLPVTEGWAHEALGLVLFVVILVLIVSTDRLLLFFLPGLSGPRRVSAGKRKTRRRAHAAASRNRGADGPPPLGRDAPNPSTEESPKADPPAGRSRRRSAGGAAPGQLNRPTAVALTVSFGLLACVQMAIALRRTGASDGQTPDARQLAEASEDTLPPSWNYWRREAFDTVTRERGHPEGRISRIWRFRKGGRQAAVSINGSFRGWHPLSLCLELQGWRIEERENHSYESIGENLPGGFTELRGAISDGRRAIALFAHFDEQNQPVGPPAARSWFNIRFWLGRLGELVKGRIPAVNQAGETQGRLTYQVQVFSESYDFITPEEAAELRELFHFARRTIRGDEG
jgi:exosortase